VARIAGSAQQERDGGGADVERLHALPRERLLDRLQESPERAPEARTHGAANKLAEERRAHGLAVLPDAAEAAVPLDAGGRYFSSRPNLASGTCWPATPSPSASGRSPVAIRASTEARPPAPAPGVVARSDPTRKLGSADEGGTSPAVERRPSPGPGGAFAASIAVGAGCVGLGPDLVRQEIVDPARRAAEIEAPVAGDRLATGSRFIVRLA
jgi:hypothetical protein